MLNNRSTKPREEDPAAIDYQACALYTPGHQTHFIQARLALEVDAAKYQKGSLVNVTDDGWINVAVDGEIRRFWTHDPARARYNVAESEGEVGLPGVDLLHAPLQDGRSIFCICVADESRGPTPCKPLSERADMVARCSGSG